MQLSWNEIRARASEFSEEWKDAHYEKGETQTFYNEFFQVFGVTRRRVATFEEPVKKLDQRYGFHRPLLEGSSARRAKECWPRPHKSKELGARLFSGFKGSRTSTPSPCQRFPDVRALRPR